MEVRLSLSNLQDQFESLRSSEWPTVKRYVKKQISKAMNECKAQATKTKKLVEGMKPIDGIKLKKITRHGTWNLRRATRTRDSLDACNENDDDNISWGSDFDDVEDESDDAYTSDDNNDDKSVTTGSYTIYEAHLKDGISMSNDNDYEFVGESSSSSDTSSNIVFNDANRGEVSPNLTDSDRDNRSLSSSSSMTSHLNSESDSGKLNSHANDRPTNADIPQRKLSIISSSSTVSSSSSASSSVSSSVNFSQQNSNRKLRLIPRPPNKPVVPPNKPKLLFQNIQRPSIDNPTVNAVHVSPSSSNNSSPTAETAPAVLNNVQRRQRLSQIKRPPSEPPPPPPPKSPPPISPPPIPFKPSTVTAIFETEINLPSTEINDNELDQEDYEAPIVTPSSSRRGSHDVRPMNECDPFVHMPISPPPFFEGEYAPMVKSAESTPNLIEDDLNYEVVDGNDEPISGYPLASAVSMIDLNRPKLPRLRSEGSSNHSKSSLRLPDLFTKMVIKKADSNFLQSMPVLNETSDPAHRPLPPVPNFGSRKMSIDQPINSYTWFHDIDRDEAAELLKSMKEEGGYLVRPSKRAGRANPFTLTIFHSGRVFHLNIRKRLDGFYALGKDKSREKTFANVKDLISYHQFEPILLTSKGEPSGQTKLLRTPC